jgi:hypothetical protein
MVHGEDERQHGEPRAMAVAENARTSAACTVRQVLVVVLVLPSTNREVLVVVLVLPITAAFIGRLGAEMKTDRIRTDIIDIVFIFIFMFGFGFEYG